MPPRFSMVSIVWRSAGITSIFPIFSLRMHRNCLIEAFLKMLTSPLDSATPISKNNNNSAIKRRLQVYRSKICHISIFGLLDLMTLNLCHVLHWYNFHQVWTRPTSSFLTYNVITAERWYITSRCDLDLWPFDLERLLYIGCHVVTQCNKF